MSDMITIQLNKEVGRKFYDETLTEKTIIDYAHMPYVKFKITFPYSTLVNIEQQVNRILFDSNTNKTKINHKALEDFRLKLERAVYTLNVELKENFLKIRLHDSLSNTNALIAHFNTLVPFPIPIVELYDFEEKYNSQLMCYNLYRLISNCISYMTNRDIVEINTYRKEVIKKSKNKKGSKKKNKITYVNAVTYTFKYIPTATLQASTRKYERHVDRWAVRGFWRTYKKGTPEEYKVWIESFRKGSNKKSDIQQVYKIGGDNNDNTRGM